MDAYHVISTPCFPNQWKIESIKWPNRDNAAHLYYADKEEALKKCRKMNMLHRHAKAKED